MVQYFIHFKATGVIGLVSAILGGLYTYAVGLILNFAIQRTKSADLRLRIAGTDGLARLVKELAASSKQSLRTRTAILTMILFLTLAGKSISFIVTSGVKASIGIQYGKQEELVAYTERLNLILPSRGNYSQVLSTIYNWRKGTDNQAVNFEVLTNSTPGRVFEVTGTRIGYRQASDAPIVPGAIAVIRQFHDFYDEIDPKCEPTSPECSLMSYRSNLSESVRPSEMLDAPLRLNYYDSNGDSISFARLPRVMAGAKDRNSEFLVERPTTRMYAYADINGKSIHVAITSASFQTELPETSEELVDSARKLIGSMNPFYPAMFNAVNASAYTPPLVGRWVSNKAILVFNTPSPKTDNLTYINCVGHEGQTYVDDHTSSAKDMISCREFRMTVLVSDGAKEWVPDPDEAENDNISLVGTDLLTMYNALAPSAAKLEDIVEDGMKIDWLDTIDQDMPSLLKNIADRLHPNNAEYSAKVTPYSYVDGILVELWSLLFIGAVLVFVAVMSVLDMVMNDAVSKASVTTLIEHSTAEDEMPVKDGKRDWEESEYPPWGLVKQGNAYQVTLRRERIGLRTNETEKLRSM
ncbi:hypothetical protein BG011_001168 [Mortierella polycephala]|uniref:Uncharacterized protein n=1 Tax=Mortierella polycephala TaxID=41804 RepID=A0A9P6TUX7_9FUNG|nr:hypothetical protein BG011_001168 [Mortierella polycephala]